MPSPLLVPVTPPEGGPDIHEIIDQSLIHTLFQPLVHLATSEVVGFEALSRGPAGALASPLAMLDAARLVGRLADLDWACRATAAKASLAADLGADITHFVNFEPETLGSAMPQRWAGDMNRAAQHLRVVVEFTERALITNPAGLLTAVASTKAAGWGVALDDVGADIASLALLPLVDPDVIKLDLRLIQRNTDADVAAIANAVRAHAERTGAVILAEGIETDEHARIARVLGATYGQGWLFGRPAALPPVVRAPLNKFPLQVHRESRTGTPFEIVSACRPVERAEKRLLLPMSHQLEDQARTGGEPLVVLGCFQDARHFTPLTQRRYARLAAQTAFTAALGVGLDREPAPGVRGADFSVGDPLTGEWNLIVIGPHFAGALVAKDLGDHGPDADRRFDFTITHDRDLVLRAARSLMRSIAPVPVPVSVAAPN